MLCKTMMHYSKYMDVNLSTLKIQQKLHFLIISNALTVQAIKADQTSPTLWNSDNRHYCQ
jgi:hypothetical protein